MDKLRSRQASWTNFSVPALSIPAGVLKVFLIQSACVIIILIVACMAHLLVTNNLAYFYLASASKTIKSLSGLKNLLGSNTQVYTFIVT
jgi:hypothetical protein